MFHPREISARQPPSLGGGERDPSTVRAWENLEYIIPPLAGEYSPTNGFLLLFVCVCVSVWGVSGKRGGGRGGGGAELLF